MTDNLNASHWFEDCPERVVAHDEHGGEIRGDLATTRDEATCTRCYADMVRMGLIERDSKDDPPW
jgi:hypothetical protein